MKRTSDIRPDFLKFTYYLTNIDIILIQFKHEELVDRLAQTFTVICVKSNSF